MSGLEQLIVGYRKSDRAKLNELEVEYGLRAFRGGRCINCQTDVMFVQSGADTLRNRDPQIICDHCWALPDVKQAIYAEL